MSSASARPASQTSSDSSSKRFVPPSGSFDNKKNHSSSTNSIQKEKRQPSDDSRHKSGGSVKSFDGFRKKSLTSSATSSLSQPKHGGFDFSSLMQQASSNSADATHKIIQIDITTAKTQLKAAKSSIDISAAKLRKAVTERSSSAKSSTISKSVDSKHANERSRDKDVGAKDLAKRQTPASGSSEKDRRDRPGEKGEKQSSLQKNLAKEKEVPSKSSTSSRSASSSKQPLPGDLRAKPQSQSLKIGPTVGSGQQQNRHLSGDLRSKRETPAASRESSDKNAPSKSALLAAAAKRQHQQNKRPAPSGLDFNKLMQQASSNLSGKADKPTDFDSSERIRDRISVSASAGKPRRSSPERPYSSSTSKHSASLRRPVDPKNNSKERTSGGPVGKDTVKRQSTSGSSEKNLSRDGGGKAAAGKKNLPREEEGHGRPVQTNGSTPNGKRILPGDVRAKTQPSAPSSAPAQSQQVKRYLPGDARYTGGPAKAAPEGFGKKPQPTSSTSAVQRHQISNGARRAGEAVIGKRSLSPPRPSRSSSSASVSMNKKPRRDSSPIDDNLARIRARERLRFEAARRAAASRDDEDMLDEEEEDYDSEMDDFIDDTEIDDLQRGDFEETLRLINPRYNKEKWKRREMEIDERRMVASYRDIAAEEKRSARLGLIEDVKEAQKGRSIAL